jgi:hypothetical protein
MLIQSTLLAHRIQKAKTSQSAAWKNNYYETYRINLTIPAARLHQGSGKCWGLWFAVDTYHVSLESYHDKLALVDNKGKATRMKNPALDRFLLAPGTIVNVGLAKSQGCHSGGGFQFEFVSGPGPVLLEHVSNPKLVII